MKLANPPEQYRPKEFAYNNKELESAINRLAQPAAVGYTVANHTPTRALDVSSLDPAVQDLGDIVATLIEDLKSKGVLA